MIHFIIIKLIIKLLYLLLGYVIINFIISCICLYLEDLNQKHHECKNSTGNNLKKGLVEKDVKSNRIAKASCC